MNSSPKPLLTLKKRSQYLALRQAARFSCNEFVLQGNLSWEECGNARVGYTVTKRIGNSVERNRIRRRLRQAIAIAAHNMTASTPAKKTDSGLNSKLSGEMVVVARPGAIDETFEQLVAKFTKGIDRLLAKGNKAV